MFTVNLKVVGPIILVAVVGGLMGLWLDAATFIRFDVPAMIAGITIGALFGLTLGLFFINLKRRWLAAVTLASFLIVVFISSGWVTTALAVAALVVAFVTFSGALRENYTGSVWGAVKEVFRVITSTKAGYVIVDNGRIVEPADPPPHFGPRSITVRPGNAVVMASYGQITRFCGPSVFRSSSLEYVGEVFSLNRITKTVRIDDAMTLDGSRLAIEISCDYGIRISEASISGQNRDIVHPDGACGLTTNELSILRDLADSGFSAFRNIGGTIETITRNEFGLQIGRTYLFDTRAVEGNLTSRINSELSSDGIVVEKVTISEVRVVGHRNTVHSEIPTARSSEGPAWLNLYEISGRQYHAFHEALVNAYTDETMAQMVTFQLDENFAEIAGGSNLGARAFNLIAWAQRNGRLPDLISAAIEFNPGNAKLRNFVDSLKN